RQCARQAVCPARRQMAPDPGEARPHQRLRAVHQPQRGAHAHPGSAQGPGDSHRRALSAIAASATRLSRRICRACVSGGGEAGARGDQPADERRSYRGRPGPHRRGNARFVRRQAEIGLLLALCFFLPLYEAPKNLAWAAYLLMWLVNRTMARDFGGRWDIWDSLLAAWLGSGILVAAFAGLHGNEWRGALDLVRYGTVLWTLKRSRFSEREERWVLGTLVASTLVGLAMGYAALWRGTEPTLQLNSVGHVNHTSIYLAIMLGVSAAWLFTGRWPLLASAVALTVLVSLFVTASRGAIGVALVMLPLLAVAWWRRSRLPLVVASAVVIAAVVLAVGG